MEITIQMVGFQRFRRSVDDMEEIIVIVEGNRHIWEDHLCGKK